MDRWIKLYVKLWQSDMFQGHKNKGVMILVFIWWLTHCKEGVCTYGLRQIADDIGFTYSSVNRAIKNLIKNASEVKHEAKHQYSTVLILNWGKYQDKPKHEPKHKRNTSETQAKHNKNIDIDIEVYREKFPGINIDEELEKANDWLKQNGFKNKQGKPYQDLEAFFRNWLRRVTPKPTGKVGFKMIGGQDEV